VPAPADTSKVPDCPPKIAEAGQHARDSYALIFDLPSSRQFSYSWQMTLQDIVTQPERAT
jgi:hypothetical protein